VALWTEYWRAKRWKVTSTPRWCEQ